MRCRWSGATLVVDTPAKLNLRLEVLGRRADGYHELDTLMASVSLFDTLRFSPHGSAISFRCDHSSVPADDTNLVVKAARAIQLFSSTNLGVAIHLQKRIPTQAGLGGGSSDAAATLVGLNKFWRLGLSPDQLHKLAATLGSDVNFFIDSAVCSACIGRGEQTQPKPFAGPAWIVIVKPPVGLSTAAVFKQLQLEQANVTGSRAILESAQSGDIGSLGRLLKNDLEAPSRMLSAELDHTLKLLQREPALGSRMTGSGSACFAICANREQARRLARRLQQRLRGEVFVVRTAA